MEASPWQGRKCVWRRDAGRRAARHSLLLVFYDNAIRTAEPAIWPMAIGERVPGDRFEQDHARIGSPSVPDYHDTVRPTWGRFEFAETYFQCRTAGELKSSL
jgi:hypothetical protein